MENLKLKMKKSFVGKMEKEREKKIRKKRGKTEMALLMLI